MQLAVLTQDDINLLCLDSDTGYQNALHYLILPMTARILCLIMRA
jgi:hypothetical protein